MTKQLKDPNNMDIKAIRGELKQLLLRSPMLTPDAATRSQVLEQRLPRTEKEADQDLAALQEELQSKDNELNIYAKTKQEIKDNILKAKINALTRNFIAEVVKIKQSDKSESKADTIAVNHALKDTVDLLLNRGGVTPAVYLARADLIVNGKSSTPLKILGTIMLALCVAAIAALILLLTLPVSAPALLIGATVAATTTGVACGLSFWAGREKGLIKAAHGVSNMYRDIVPGMIDETPLDDAKRSLLQYRAEEAERLSPKP